MIGKPLGHYESIESLGAGGMGQVYRSRDSSLKREVAAPLVLSAQTLALARISHQSYCAGPPCMR